MLYTAQTRTSTDNTNVTKLNTKLNTMTYNAIANEEFGMDYAQLGPGEKEWVRDEYEMIKAFGYDFMKSKDKGRLREY